MFSNIVRKSIRHGKTIFCKIAGIHFVSYNMRTDVLLWVVEAVFACVS